MLEEFIIVCVMGMVVIIVVVKIIMVLTDSND
jgi:hypothetical protein